MNNLSQLNVEHVAIFLLFFDVLFSCEPAEFRVAIPCIGVSGTPNV